MLNNKQRKILDQLAQKLSSAGVHRASELDQNPASGPTSPRKPHPNRDTQTIEQLLDATVKTNQAGRFYSLRRSVRRLWPQSPEVLKHYRWAIAGPGLADIDNQQFPQLAQLAQTPLEKVIYLDIETCGFAGTMVFLIGLMWFENDDFVVEQLLAGDYAQEPAILAQTADILDGFELMTSFNGKRFDLPFIRERAIFHKQRQADIKTHLDLLFPAKRRWGKDLPNCQLQTLEFFLCKRRRVGDIPGDQIPQAYHDFVRDGNAGKIKSIIHHNLLDLLTMAQLVAMLAAGQQPDS